MPASDGDLTTARGLTAARRGHRRAVRRGSGPGGQHRNVTASAVELVADLNALHGPGADRVRSMLGELVRVKADDSRSQWRNRSIARDRLVELIDAATGVPSACAARPGRHAARQRRLDDKSRASARSATARGVRGTRPGPAARTRLLPTETAAPAAGPAGECRGIPAGRPFAPQRSAPPWRTPTRRGASATPVASHGRRRQPTCSGSVGRRRGLPPVAGQADTAGTVVLDRLDVRPGAAGRASRAATSCDRRAVPSWSVPAPAAPQWRRAAPAMARPRPNTLSDRSEPSTNAPKTQNMIAAAAVMTRAVARPGRWPRPWRCRRCGRTLADAGEQEHLVVHRQAEDHGEEHHPQLTRRWGPPCRRRTAPDPSPTGTPPPSRRVGGTHR